MNDVENDRLNDKQERFVGLYIDKVKTGNMLLWEAYKEAGYTANTTNSARAAASRLLHSVKIQRRIRQLTKQIIGKECFRTFEEMIAQMEQLSEISPRDFLDQDGKLKPRSKTKDFEGTLKKIEFFSDGRVKKIEVGRDERWWRLESQLKGFLIERVKHEGEINSNVSMDKFKESMEDSEEKEEDEGNDG